MIKKIQIKRWLYHAKYRYVTVNNVVLAVALLIAFGWTWGSVSMMQRNYSLQRKLDDKQRQLTLHELEVDTLELQRNYYRSDEYQELAARRYLGLANKDEKLIVLPPNSEEAKKVDEQTDITVVAQTKTSNLQQWMDFLSGKNISNLQ